MKYLRKYYWMIEGYVKKHFRYVVIGVVCSVVIFFLIFRFIDSVIFHKPLKIGVVGNFTKDTVPDEILRKVSRGLTKKDAKGKYVGDLAEKVIVKNKGTLYEIKLRPNIYWHDGRLFTTADINYNFKDVKFVARNSLEGYFILKNPYAPFLELLSIPITFKNLVGLGDWRVEQIEWDGDFIKSISLKNAERILYRFYPNDKIINTAFRLGEVNRIENVSDISQIKLWRSARIERQVDEEKVVAIFFNFKGSTVVTDKSFRQALSYAIQKNQFSQKKAYSPYSSQDKIFYTDAVKKYFFDEETAISQFKKTVTDAKKINLTLYTVPEYKSVADTIVAGWNKIFKSKFKVKVSSGVPYQWQMFLTTVEIPQDPDQYSLWHSNKTLYFSAYRNLKVDKLLEDGRTETNTEKRVPIYHDLQKTLSEDLPAIFLFYPWKYAVSY